MWLFRDRFRLRRAGAMLHVVCSGSSEEELGGEPERPLGGGIRLHKGTGEAGRAVSCTWLGLTRVQERGHREVRLERLSGARALRAEISFPRQWRPQVQGGTDAASREAVGPAGRWAGPEWARLMGRVAERTLGFDFPVYSIHLFWPFESSLPQLFLTGYQTKYCWN